MTIQEFLYEKLGEDIFFRTPQKEKQFLYGLLDAWAKEVAVNFLCYVLNKIEQPSLLVDKKGLTENPDDKLTINQIFDEYIQLFKP